MVAIIVLLATLAIAVHFSWVGRRGREIGPKLPDDAYAGAATKIRISGERTGSVAIEIGTLEAHGKIGICRSALETHYLERTSIECCGSRAVSS